MLLDPLFILERFATAHNILSIRVKPPFQGLEKFDYGLRNSLDPYFDWEEFGKQILKFTPEHTLIFAEGVFNLNYALFRIPDEKDSVFMLGPWVNTERSEEDKQWAIKNFGEAGNNSIQEYYNGVRVIKDESFAATIMAFVGAMMPEDDYHVDQEKEFVPFIFKPDKRYFTEPDFQQEIPVSMLEERYANENKILDAVAHGDTETALAACHQMGRFSYGTRFTGTLYQCKAKLTVFNTLLRKSIERSKIHPYYIDKISSRYAQLIENMTDVDDKHLIWDMVREYCSYVRLYSLKDYSPLVQKVINYINLNLASSLSLKELAAMCYISPPYLSNLFKHEVGITLTDYINSQRIHRAARLLTTTDSKIATIAEMVGILDGNYFTKIFKRVMGMTPTEYRKRHKKTLPGEE